MLSSLSIENYALIRSAHVEFGKGFSVIVGETGAGKSIILQALSLALGTRAEKEALNDKERKCVCEAVFLLEEKYRKAFEDADLDFESENVFRREILPSGKSRAFVNGTPVQLTQMKLLADTIIDIHSQHDTMRITERAYRTCLLDSFVSKPETLAEYDKSYSHLCELRRELAQTAEELSRLEKENSYISFVHEELEKMNLKAGEQASLEAEVEFMRSSEQIGEAVSESLSLFESEDYPAVLTNLLQVKNRLAKLSHLSQDLQQLSERCESSLIELRDVYSELSRVGERLNYDPAALEEKQQRLDAIYALERKHGVDSVEGLLELQQQFSESLSSLEDLQSRKAALEKEIADIEPRLADLAQRIFELRQQAAEQIEQGALPLLSKVGMEKAIVKIDITQRDELDRDAACEVEFLFNSDQSNPSHLRALDKVASGGEMSRLMLVLKSLESKRRGLPTIVFDEIDTGISGKVASGMAAVIRAMSSRVQVIAITHLPQTAAMAHHQYRVSKTQTAEGSESSVRLLQESERAEEIARLLSAAEPTSAALAAAQDLLDNAKR